MQDWPNQLIKEKIEYFHNRKLQSSTAATMDLIACADKEDGGVDLQPSRRFLSLLLEGQIENIPMHIAHLKLP
jgi:hypothetical protein